MTTDEAAPATSGTPEQAVPVEADPSETATDETAQSGDTVEQAAEDAPATSPKLDRLDETIKEARRAADQALAPQRDE